ncbi:MAG TPA: hypothetical protein VLM37_08880 [Fibrobacteraceae bacterium]|nr:hypothetical protein [Fibrobacteraceae bacterium]
MKRAFPSLLFSFLFVLVPLSEAGKGPTHKSLRAYAMGNAFVAVAEDKEAVYYNPAGLNLINRLGNYEDHPELGYYPSNFIDMRVNIGLRAPYTEASQAYELGKKIQALYNGAQDDADLAGTSAQDALIDSLGAHPELSDDLNKFDKLPINFSAKFDMEMAVPHWGGAIWVDAGMAPYIESGIITPSAGMDTFYIDAVAQTAVGFSLTDRWSAGIGYKMAKREYLNDFTVSLLDWEDALDTLDSEFDAIRDDASEIKTIGHALEFGTLYQWKRDVRFGASLRNWFIKPLGDEKITPNLTAGVAFSPRKLQRNTGFARKVNLAIDYEDMLNNDRNYKPLSHLDLGMELEQTLIAVPDWPSLRLLKVRAGIGLKGGYPTAGLAVEALRFVELEVCTWAEEAGYFTGEDENRFWVLQLSLGI